jgi:transposase
VGRAYIEPEPRCLVHIPARREEAAALPGVSPGWCGIAGHQAQLTACRRQVEGAGHVTQEVRAFGPPTSALLTLLAWLVAPPCPVVALESTGVYWQPVYHVRSGAVDVLVGHPSEMRRRPGRKTAPAEARWSAAWLAHGRMRPSFLPPPPIRAWRALPRTRVAVVQTRRQTKNRVYTSLAATNITGARVVSERCGGSGRRMRAALIAGARDPRTLAALAVGK